MKKLVAVVMGLALVLAVTNPGSRDYDDWVRERLGGQNQGSRFAAQLIPDALIQGATTRQDGIFFSVYSTSIPGGRYLQTLGILRTFFAIQSQVQQNTQSPQTGVPTSRPVITAFRPDPAPDEGQCNERRILQEDAAFVPGSGTGTLRVEQAMVTEPGMSRTDPYCRWTVTIWASNSYFSFAPPIWRTELSAPGLIVVDGVWRPQFSHKHSWVKLVHLLPPPLDKTSEVLLYSADEGADGGMSEAQVVGVITPGGPIMTLLRVEQHTAMNISLFGSKLRIDGYYIPRGGCAACGEKRSVTVHYSPEMNRLIPDDADFQAIQFYRYLTHDG